MSEDDRAAKAARAKALLKKRQQKKAAESAGPTSDIASQPSRTSTPALAEPAVDELKRNHIDDVFGTKDKSDSSWVSSLPRVLSPGRDAISSVPSSTKSPPPITSTGVSAPHIAASGPSIKELELLKEIDFLRLEVTSLQEKTQHVVSLEGGLKTAQTKVTKLEESLEQEKAQYMTLETRLDESRRENSATLKNCEETISLLVSEKATLTSELHKLDEAVARAQNVEENLSQEREKNADMSEQLSKLQEQCTVLSSQLEDLSLKDKEATEKQREQERQLHIANASATEARKDAERYERNLKELEDQIQNDDRLERVETSLKNSQERADELEFQLSKVKHSHSQLKGEKEALELRLSESTDLTNGLQSQFSDLEKEHETVLIQLNSITEERVTLETERASLEQSSQSKDAMIAGLNGRLAQAVAEINDQKRQVQTLQGDLRVAHRRLDDSEKAQKKLQAEGTNLMRSLDELRPKVVELTEDKVQLSDKVAHITHTLHDRDATIAILEGTLEEARQETEKVQDEWRMKISKLEQEQTLAVSSSSDRDKAFAELQNELEEALDSVRTLELERQSLRQLSESRQQEVEYLTDTTQSQMNEMNRLQDELVEQKAAQEEEEDILEQAQNEIESLRSQLASATSELAELRQNRPPSSQSDGQPSWSTEMLNSLRQQHALDLSASQSQIRALENSVFEAEARSHNLQKRVHALETQLAQVRPSSTLGRRSFSPNHYSRPASRLQSRTDPGRSSFSSKRPTLLSRSLFDQGLSPETKHKRKVSLSMLKARIESEIAANPSLSLRPLSPVESEASLPEYPHQQQMGHHRPQFMDESHIFWCSSCSGELVVL